MLSDITPKYRVKERLKTQRAVDQCWDGTSRRLTDDYTNEQRVLKMQKWLWMKAKHRSVKTHWTKESYRARWLRGNALASHSGRSRVQIPWPSNLVEVFSGFLNLKIAKELVIFQRQMSGWSPYSTIIGTIFNVYSFAWSETIVVKMVA